MKSRHCLIFLLVSISACPQSAPRTEQPQESEHRSGPDGLEGWTLNDTIPDGPTERSTESYPFTLVLARHGHIIRRIEGSPFVWNWIFWAGGKQIAYEAGPLHFGMLCTLADIATGRELAHYDCFHELPADAPDWEKALESSR